MTARPVFELTLASGHVYLPGEQIEGVAAWRAERPLAAIELRLFWFTSGKGTEDLEIVERLAFEAPQAVERRPFTLRLPDEPYSFSGSLVSLRWALELVALPDDHQAARVDVVIGPERRALVLAELNGGR